MLDADTLKKLEQRQTELATVFIDETDSSKWPDTATRDGRGDRYWQKKNAGATATLIVKIQTILDYALSKPVPTDPSEPTPGDAEEEKAEAGSLAAAAMRDAQEIIDRHRGRFRKK
jgi:hypothetical protein